MHLTCFYSPSGASTWDWWAHPQTDRRHWNRPCASGHWRWWDGWPRRHSPPPCSSWSGPQRTRSPRHTCRRAHSGCCSGRTAARCGGGGGRRVDCSTHSSPRTPWARPCSDFPCANWTRFVETVTSTYRCVRCIYVRDSFSLSLSLCIYIYIYIRQQWRILGFLVKSESEWRG